METMKIKELYERFQRLSPQEMIVDVRSPEEYAEGHIPGSKNIPYGDVTRHLTELKKYQKVYVHCQAGGRAQKAADSLCHAGLKNVICITGSGMKDWLEAGYPIE